MSPQHGSKMMKTKTLNMLEAHNYTALQDLINANQIDGLEIVHDVI
jgi:hypothetical protein